MPVRKASVAIQSSEGNLGCETMTTIFSALTDDTVVAFKWNFDDGSPVSTVSKPEHTFTAPGDYNVTLQYSTASGCKGTTQYSIHVLEKPEFDFTASPGTTICGNNPVLFIVSGSNLAGTYYWNFGDPDVYGSASTPFSHQYFNDSMYTVSLIIDNNGCRDTVTKTNYITVLPPFTDIASASNTCNGSRGLVSFQDASRKATGFSWDFGDGSPLYTYTTPQTFLQHEYTQSGTYLAKLTTTNGNCHVTDSVSVKVLLKQTPLLSAAITTFCSSDTLHSLISGMEPNPYTVLTGEQDYDLTSANYGDGSLFGGSMVINENPWQNPFRVDITQLNVNQTRVRIITTSRYFNCPDTTNYIQFTALGPTAAFTTASNNFCFKSPVVFTDHSKPSHNVPITKWEWQFGDSSSQVTTQGNNVVHQYVDPNTYRAKLIITDANGCTASTSAEEGILIAKGPKAAFTISENPALPQTDVFFYNQTNITNTNFFDNAYTWNFGDGTVLNKQEFADSVVHRYLKQGVDTVTLVASNNIERCADTVTRILIIKNPNLVFTYNTTYINPDSGCPPVIASFINQSINTTKVSWDFGDGNTADNLDNASHIYEKPGIYKVTLYGYFLDGSVDSVFEMITIKGPYATLVTDKLFACGAEEITLSATSANTQIFTWDFGDGTLTNNSDTSASHRYLTPGVYTPALIVKDGNNCQFPFFLTQPIVIDTLHLSINKMTQASCASSQLYFTPTIVSEAKDELGLPLTYHWRFGTGKAKDTANTEVTQFMYSQPGKYEVTLSGASPYGCTYIARDTIIVQPMPVASISGPSNVCEGNLVSFTGEANRPVVWQWQFPNGDTSSLQNPQPVVFGTPGTDSILLVVNDNGCFDTAWHNLQVNGKPIIDLSPATAQLCEGDSLQLLAHDGVTFSWTPARNILFSNTGTPVVYPDSTTTYRVKVTNEAGCSSVDSIDVAVTRRFQLTATSPVFICPGSIAQLNAAGAYNYHWLGENVSNSNIANPTTSLYASQLYTVTGSDSIGCFTDTSFVQVITAPLPLVEAGPTRQHLQATKFNCRQRAAATSTNGSGHRAAI